MIEEFRGYRAYVARVKSGEEEIDHLWPCHVAKAMSCVSRRLTQRNPLLKSHSSTFRWFYLFNDTEDWAKASRLKKALNYAAILFLFFLWLCVIIRLFIDWKELPISKIAEGMSLSLGGLMTFISLVSLALNRDSVTDMIRVIDEKYRAVPKSSARNKAWWEKARETYILEWHIVCLSIVPSVSMAAPQLVYMIVTGELFYQTAIPLSKESYTWQWWVQMAYQTINVPWSGIAFSLKEIITLSLFYHVSEIFEEHSEQILELCAEKDFDGETEYRKLQHLIGEVTFLNEYGGCGCSSMPTLE